MDILVSVRKQDARMAKQQHQANAQMQQQQQLQQQRKREHVPWKPRAHVRRTVWRRDAMTVRLPPLGLGGDGEPHLLAGSSAFPGEPEQLPSIVGLNPHVSEEERGAISRGTDGLAPGKSRGALLRVSVKFIIFG